MFKLVISDDEGKTTVVPLVRDEITVGRKEGNTIRLTERNVSRRHARLRKQNGAFVVEDLGSYNGIKVNGRKIEQQTELNPGDQLTIGDYQLALQQEATEQPAGAEQAAAAVTPAAPPAAAAQATPPPRLVMLTPPHPGAEYALTRPNMMIGRAEDLDIWVNHRSVSREHARVEQEGDHFKIVDNGSANGIRVNSEEMPQKILESGDELEVGQVRFRFVAAGEQYVFDADRTVQMGAVSAPAARSKLPLFAAVGILGAAIVVGAIIALSSGGDEGEMQSVAAADGQPTNLASPALGGDDEDEDDDEPMPESVRVAIKEAVKRCNAALNDESFADAITQAEIALSHDDDHEGAIACKNEAEARRSEADTFATGRKALEEDDCESAYFAFEELPSDSELREEAEVERAMTCYAEQQNELAKEELDRGNLREAQAHAESVLALEDPPTDLRAEAAKLEQRARLAMRRRGSRARASAARAAARASSGGGGGGGGGGSTSSAGSSGGGSSGGGGGGAATSGGASPMEQAQSCIMKGDNACVVRALEGKARTPRELAMLIETYRTMGNGPAAKRNMRLFIRRFPNDGRAPRYRQMLQNQ